METLAIINQKGGVGKSTTALALGAGLLLRGYHVLMVDLDPQGNLSYATGAEVHHYGAYGALQAPTTAPEEIVQTKQGDIIPASLMLAGAEIDKETRLKEALEALYVYHYDYVVIDTPPALGTLTINALVAAHKIIIPAQADIFSLEGIKQLAISLGAVRSYCNPGLSIAGILLTRYSRRAAIRRDVAEALEALAHKLGTKVFKTKIRECVALVESQTKRESVFAYAPRSNGAKDYKALIDEILEERK